MNEKTHGDSVYFLDFLPLGLVGSITFLGRPLPGTLRRISKTDASYKASDVTDFMPSLWIRTFTALGSMFSSFANSMIVKKFPFSFICKLSVNVTKSFNLLNKCNLELQNIFNNCNYLLLYAGHKCNYKLH